MEVLLPACAACAVCVSRARGRTKGLVRRHVAEREEEDSEEREDRPPRRQRASEQAPLEQTDHERTACTEDDECLHVGVRERLHVAVDGGGKQPDVHQVDAHARPRQPVELGLPSRREAQGAQYRGHKLKHGEEAGQGHLLEAELVDEQQARRRDAEGRHGDHRFRIHLHGYRLRLRERCKFGEQKRTLVGVTKYLPSPLSPLSIPHHRGRTPGRGAASTRLGSCPRKAAWRRRCDPAPWRRGSR